MRHSAFCAYGFGGDHASYLRQRARGTKGNDSGHSSSQPTRNAGSPGLFLSFAIFTGTKTRCTDVPRGQRGTHGHYPAPEESGVMKIIFRIVVGVLLAGMMVSLAGAA